MLGQQEKGINLLSQALDIHRRALGLTRLQTVLTLMADAYCKVRQPDDGLRQVAEAISVTNRTQGRYYEAETHRVRGDRSSRPTAPSHDAWLVIGRRGGKSFVLAVIAIFLACFKDWRPFLAPGEAGTIMIIATDRRQAKFERLVVD